MAGRPNFLFIITDQQRADFLGCAGHPALRTPHIDSIAARGRRFERFYVANPVCMPNRSTLMTGRMPSVHGVRSNGIALSFRASTFVELMRRHGYRTALLGKSHLQNMTGMPPILARAAPPEGRLPPPPDLAEARKLSAEDGPVDAESPSGWRDDPGWDLPRPFYGFERVDLCTDHGDLVGGHYWRWLRDRHDDPDACGARRTRCRTTMPAPRRGGRRCRRSSTRPATSPNGRSISSKATRRKAAARRSSP